MSAQSASSGYPFRQISRILHGLQLTGVANCRVLLQKQFDRAIIIAALCQHGLPDWFSGNRLMRPRGLTCFMSISALAASFNKPFETIRRHVNALIAEGTCVQSAGGVAISADPDTAARILQYLALTHDALLGAARDMAELGLLPRTVAPTDPCLTRSIVGIGLDMQLAPFETLRDPIPDWTLMLVWGVVRLLCVRHITTDPELSARYAHDSTPDRVRVPVKLQVIAAASGLPYSSVWRHVKSLTASGSIKAKDGDYIVGTDYLRGPGLDERTIAAVSYFRRQLAGLTRHGFNPAETICWLDGPPRLLMDEFVGQA